MVWWWRLLRKPHSCALGLTACSVVSSLSLLRLVSLSLGSIIWSSELVNLNTYGGVDPVGVFSQFLSKVANIIAPKLSIIFRRLNRLGSFPKWWRSANVTAIP